MIELQLLDAVFSLVLLVEIDPSPNVRFYPNSERIDGLCFTPLVRRSAWEGAGAFPAVVWSQESLRSRGVSDHIPTSGQVAHVGYSDRTSANTLHLGHALTAEAGM